MHIRFPIQRTPCAAARGLAPYYLSFFCVSLRFFAAIRFCGSTIQTTKRRTSSDLSCSQLSTLSSQLARGLSDLIRLQNLSLFLRAPLFTQIVRRLTPGWEPKGESLPQQPARNDPPAFVDQLGFRCEQDRPMPKHPARGTC